MPERPLWVPTSHSGFPAGPLSRRDKPVQQPGDLPRPVRGCHSQAFGQFQMSVRLPAARIAGSAQSDVL